MVHHNGLPQCHVATSTPLSSCPYPSLDHPFTSKNEEMYTVSHKTLRKKNVCAGEGKHVWGLEGNAYKWAIFTPCFTFRRKPLNCHARSRHLCQGLSEQWVVACPVTGVVCDFQTLTLLVRELPLVQCRCLLWFVCTIKHDWQHEQTAPTAWPTGHQGTLE